MAQPKTHGILNNCPVNVCLPEIMEVFDYLAAVDEDKTTPRQPNTELHRAEYERLKQTFEAFYGLTNITWKKLSQVFTQNQTEAQLIMGPVFRQFMGHELQNDGRYLALTMDQATDALLKPLGISVKEHTHQRGHVHIFDIKAPNAITTVAVHNTPLANHWERVAPGQPAQLFDDVKAMSQPMTVVYDTLSASGTKDQAVAALATLKTTVQQQLAQNTAPALAEQKPVRPSVKNNVQAFIDQLHTANLTLTGPVKGPKIAIDKIEGQKAVAGESDEDFAKRLQVAEIEKYEAETKTTFRRR